ncbi:Gfo/Idh/MocA family protein [Amycolatopsis sp. cmx-4-83]|uniref:Gfo/Idh/MocA family protein n=1 Tax=Amycolatopsis sp. cmx-4-83 TaxID=2790940 RepID=UPI00397E1D4C
MTVRVALIGLGWAARSIWLPRLRALPGYRVTDLVDANPVVLASVAQELPGACRHRDPDELKPAQVDLAIVAVPNHAHSAVAADLLARGIPVFVEKPVCLSSAEADRLAGAEAAGGAVLLAGSASRYRADVRALHEVAGTLGEIRHVGATWVRSRGVPDSGGWFTNRRLAGGGALVDLGWHLLDAITPLLGPAGFDQVAGSVSADFVRDPEWSAAWKFSRPATGDADVEDTVRAFLVTEAGLPVSLRASWASHEALDSTVLTVEGSAATATLRCTFGFSPNRAAGSKLTRTEAGETVEVPLPDEPIGAEYDRQLAGLPARLADPAARGAAIAETRRSIGVIERIYASAYTARTALAGRR